MSLDKPVICVSNGSDYSVTKGASPRQIVSPSSYTRAVALAGGIPVLTSEQCAEEMARLCDGLILTGGEDLEPKWFGEDVLNDTVVSDPARDSFEFSLFEAFEKAGKPIFGICRGSQVINVALGGTLYQDLVAQKGWVHFNKDIRHWVKTAEGSLLHGMFGEEFNVNSTHHQAVKDLAPGLKVTARSVEGIVEAYEHEVLPIFATQFHPERLTNTMWDERTPDFAPLFEYFVNLCRHE